DLGRGQETVAEAVREVEQGHHVLTRHQEGVSLEHRPGVEEGQEVRLVQHHLGRSLPRDDRAEDAAGHHAPTVGRESRTDPHDITDEPRAGVPRGSRRVPGAFYASAAKPSATRAFAITSLPAWDGWV